MKIKWCFKDWVSGATAIFDSEAEAKKFVIDYNYFLVNKYHDDPLEEDEYIIFQTYYNCSAEEVLDAPLLDS